MTTPEPRPVGLKEIEPKGYIGIDFGTSNSHFAVCEMSSSQVSPLASEPTYVLWQRRPSTRQEELVCYGTTALRQYAMLDDGERRGYRFSASFKPHLVHSEMARQDAYAFLRATLAQIKAGRLVEAVGSEAGYPVVVGVPAEIGDEHVRATAEAAERAGFGPVACVAEPLGALAYHLAEEGDRRLTLKEAREGVVVVDFGGGTLDVAIVDDKGIRQPWGEPALGGQLFDDLFYQWLLDQNPGLRVPTEDWLYVWADGCRKLKEEFSHFWAGAENRPNNFVGFVLVGDRRMKLRNASVDEFEQRARVYRPTPECRNHLRLVGALNDRLRNGGTIDLLDWVQETLAKGLGKASFRRVILTGGSASWKFMIPMAAEVFGVSVDCILCSRDPQRAVGSGLALYHVLKRRLEKRRHALRGYRPERMKKFAGDLAERIGQFVRKVPHSVLDPLMEQVQALFLRWHDQGGALRAVERQVKALCKDFEPQLDRLLRNDSKQLSQDILTLMRKHLRQWFDEYDIERDVDAFIPPDVTVPADATRVGGGVADDAANSFAVAFAASLAALVVAVVVVVKLTVLTALSPLLLTPIGIVIAVVAVIFGRQVAEDFVKDHPWGSWPLQADLRAMWLVLSETRLRERLGESRDQAERELRTRVEEAVQPFQKQAEAKLEEVMDQVIADLSVLDQIRQSRPDGQSPG
jgi:molecular chaperone DnaK